MHHLLRRSQSSANFMRSLLILVFVLMTCAELNSTTGELSAQGPSDARGDNEITIWVQRLGSSKITERDAATQHLKMAGLIAIPELIKAAQGTSPEVTARAIDCLTFLYESPNLEISSAADAALEQFLKQGPPAAAQRTEQAFEFELAPARRRNAIAAIQSLGGIIVPEMEPDDRGELEVEANLENPGTIQHIILSKNWRGGTSSIKYFERLHPELRTVYVTTDAAMKSEDLEQYRAELRPKINVEPRGGYLGIKGPPFDLDKCEVGGIAPNSPAKVAGLRNGDHLTHLNGMPIKGFLGLTTLLLQYKSGDTVTIDVLRPAGDHGLQLEDLDVAVTLGEWGARPKPTAVKTRDVEQQEDLPKPLKRP